MPGHPLVSLQQVSKAFATTLAVDNISFTVRRGETFALLGPNGAGKSTVVRMIIGMLMPDHGSVIWCDEDGTPTRLKRSEIGYLPEDRGLYKSEKVGRILRYFAELHGLSSREASEAASTWLTRLEMEQHAGSKLETLSKGNQQKIQIAAALVHRPKLAVLDEPFSGLDPLNQEMLMSLMSELKQDGTTILLSAHQLNLVERLADQVVLMNKGREVLSGTVPQIKRSAYGGRVIEVEYEADSLQADLSLLHEDTDVIEIQAVGPNQLRLLLDATASMPTWLERLSALGTLENLSSSQLTLHEIYLRALGSGSLSKASRNAEIATSLP